MACAIRAACALASSATGQANRASAAANRWAHREGAAKLGAMEGDTELVAGYPPATPPPDGRP